MDRAARPQKESGTDRQTGQLQEMKKRKQSELQQGQEKEQENKTAKDRKAGRRSNPEQYIDRRRCDENRYNKKRHRKIDIEQNPIQAKANREWITAICILVAAGVLVSAGAIGRRICCSGTGSAGRSTNAVQSEAEIQHGGTGSAGRSTNAAQSEAEMQHGGTGSAGHLTNAAQNEAEMQHGGTDSAGHLTNAAQNEAEMQQDGAASFGPSTDAVQSEAGAQRNSTASVRSATDAAQSEAGTQRDDTASAPRPRVALTFDDGPHPIYTKKLLDGLKSRGVHATFFVVGENISGSEDLIRRMAEEGHVIGNHTYDHVKLSGISDEQACEEVQKTDALVRNLTGVGTEFVRPPFGSWKKTLECRLEMIPVLWDVDPLDWTTKNTATVVQRVLNEVQPGDIVLLHDFYESSVDAALEITDQLLEQGYEFVTVDELILL